MRAEDLAIGLSDQSLPHFSCWMTLPHTSHIFAEQVPEGVELAVQKMKEGERNIITIQPEFGYGDKEFKAPLAVVPAGSVLTYDLMLKSFVNVSLPSTCQIHACIAMDGRPFSFRWINDAWDS